MPAGLNGVTGIAAQWNHIVALKNSGTVVTWGHDEYGYGLTNVPVGLTDVVGIAAAVYHTVALKSNGTVVAWGNNGYGQTNVPAGLNGVTAIAAGDVYTLALAGTTNPSHTFSLTWKTSYDYGEYFTYGISGALNTPAQGKLFWANGTNVANILSSTPILTYTIPVATNYTNTVLLSDDPLTNSPFGSTHILMIVEPTNSFRDVVSHTPAAALTLPCLALTKWRVPENWTGFLGDVVEADCGNYSTNLWTFYIANLVEGTGDIDNHLFRIRLFNTLSNTVAFDYETKTNYNIRVHTDAFGGLDGAFTIEVTDTNDPPTGILLSTNRIQRNKPVGTVVGTFSPVDQDATGSHSDYHDSWIYSLVSGSGNNDNSLFAVSGNTLITQTVFDGVTKTNFSVRVRVTDSGSTWCEGVFTLNVNPTETNGVSLLLNPMKNSGVYSFDLTAESGGQFAIQTSTNLITWDTIRAVSIPAGGITNILENVTSSTRKFYRAMRQ